MPGEKSFLVIPTRPPCQHRRNIQIFSELLPPHVERLNTFLRTIIVTATCSVHMMICAIPAKFRHIDPSLQFKCRRIFFYSGRDRQWNLLRNIFRSTRQHNIIFPGRQFHMLTIRAVYLWLKEKIRVLIECCNSSRWQRVDARKSSRDFSIRGNCTCARWITSLCAGKTYSRIFIRLNTVIQNSLHTIGDQERCHRRRIIIVFDMKRNLN